MVIIKIQKIKLAKQRQLRDYFYIYFPGDTGPGIHEWVKELTENKFVFPHLKVVFPSAPKIPYTAQGGEVCYII